MRNAFIDTILAECNNRDDLFVITGDAGLGVFDRFKEEFPERFLNMGVAEQNMISFASGLAMTGYKVLLYNIIPFLMYRCYEQVRNDICYQELPVILAGIGSGVTYSPMGMTHYSVEDIGIARTLPNLTVISPIDPMEARAAARYALDAVSPVYVRLAKRGEPNIHEQEPETLDHPHKIVAGDGCIALVCHGSIVEEVLKASQILAAENIRPSVFSMPVVQPLNCKVIEYRLCSFRTVICVEEHYDNSGLGSILADLKVTRCLSWNLIRIGIPHSFIHAVNDIQGMRKQFGISATEIVAAVRQQNGV